MSDIISFEFDGFIILLSITSDLKQNRYAVTLPVYHSGACLLSGVIKFKLCLAIHELGFVARDISQALHTNYTCISFSELARFIIWVI